MGIEKICTIIFKLKYKIGFSFPFECNPVKIWYSHYCFFGQSIPKCSCCEPHGNRMFYRKWGFEFQVEYPIIGMVT